MNSTQLHNLSLRGAKVGEALWPCSVIIAGTTYAAECPRTEAPRVALEAGSGEEDHFQVIRIRKELLATPPARHTFLTMDGAQWKIRAVGGQGLGHAVWVLEVEKRK